MVDVYRLRRALGPRPPSGVHRRTYLSGAFHAQSNVCKPQLALPLLRAELQAACMRARELGSRGGVQLLSPLGMWAYCLATHMHIWPLLARAPACCESVCEHQPGRALGEALPRVLVKPTCSCLLGGGAFSTSQPTLGLAVLGLEKEVWGWGRAHGCCMRP